MGKRGVSMDRLTYKDEFGRWTADVHYGGKVEHLRDVPIDRLAAYEDKIPFDRLDEAATLVKDRDEGRAVLLPCKPNATYLHRNYNTGGLELNIELHDFDGEASTLPWEEIDACAYWE